MKTPAPISTGMKLQELCDRIGVPYRDARYALDRGILPKGIEADPGRGRHRLFDASQAFHLAMVLKLKAAGVHTPMAGEMAQWATRIKGIAVNAGWDHQFSPFDGRLATENKWVLEVGDGRYVRFGTDANPSHQGMDFSGWTDMSTKKAADCAPVVTIRVDVSELAKCFIEPSPKTI